MKHLSYKKPVEVAVVRGPGAVRCARAEAGATARARHMRSTDSISGRKPSVRRAVRRAVILRNTYECERYLQNTSL